MCVDIMWPYAVPDKINGNFTFVTVWSREGFEEWVSTARVIEQKKERGCLYSCPTVPNANRVAEGQCKFFFLTGQRAKDIMSVKRANSVKLT